MLEAQSSSSKFRPVNVSLPSDEVAEAKSYGLNVSQISRQALSAALRAERRRRYVEENHEAIEEYNAWVDTHGVMITPLWMQDDGEI